MKKIVYCLIALLVLASFLFVSWYRKCWICMAIDNGKLQEVTDSVFVTDSLLGSGLEHAYKTGKKEDFATLLEKGADGNISIYKDGYRNPLILFTAAEKDSYWLEQLLEHGVSVKTSGRMGSTVLIAALYSERPKNLALVLKHGGDVHDMSRKELPLCAAAGTRVTEAFELLIAYDVNLNYPATRNGTYFDTYFRMGWEDRTSRLDEMDDLREDFNECMVFHNIDTMRMRWVETGPNKIGHWEFPKLRPDEPQELNIKRKFIEVRKRRAESIYNSPEEWGIVDRIRESQ